MCTLEIRFFNIRLAKRPLNKIEAHYLFHFLVMREPATFDFDRTLKILSRDERDAEVALRELYNHIAPKLYSSAKRRLRSQEFAEDVVQEVFVYIWLKRQELKGIKNFEFYLYGIIKKMCLHVIRSAVNAEIIKRKHLQKLQDQHDPAKEENAKRLESLVAKLPEPRRSIFQLVKIEGMDRKVIAERFNVTVVAVDHHVSRALKFINAAKSKVATCLSAGVALLQYLFD